ncbi:MAG: 50S ribosomal protein L15 [Desulfobacterota bacterium]|nr:50S ribosomal protein L15 [Thermodesulfobacteriota bacterium]
MDLSSLHPVPGAKKKRKRVGRGPGSGHGKTSCRGHKGQKARSGGGKTLGFEGGQMPLQRRLPKRGFTNIFKKRYAIVHVQDLCRFEKDSVVDPAALLQAGLVKNLHDGVKILGDGTIDRPLMVKAHRWSRAAYEKIVAAGGTLESI